MTKPWSHNLSQVPLLLPTPPKDVDIDPPPTISSDLPPSSSSALAELQQIDQDIKLRCDRSLELLLKTPACSLNAVRRELITSFRDLSRQLEKLLETHRAKLQGLSVSALSTCPPAYLHDGLLHVLQGSSIVVAESSPSSVYAHTLARISSSSASTPVPSPGLNPTTPTSMHESFTLTVDRKAASRFSTLTAGHGSLRLPFVSTPKPTVSSAGSISRSSVSASVQATLAPAAGDVKIENPKERLLQALELHQKGHQGRLPMPDFDPPSAPAKLVHRSPSAPTVPLSATTMLNAPSVDTTAFATSPSTPSTEDVPVSASFLPAYEGLPSLSSTSSISDVASDSTPSPQPPCTPRRSTSTSLSPSPSMSSSSSPSVSSSPQVAGLSSLFTSGVATSLSAIRSIRPTSFFLPEIDESTPSAPPSSFSMTPNNFGDSRKSTIKQKARSQQHPLLQVETTSISSLVEGGLHQNANYELGQTKIGCKVFHAGAFELLRKKLGIEGVLLESLSRSAGWDAEGGKSNAGFFKTSDDRFVIKEAVSKMLGGSDLVRFLPVRS